MVLEKWGQMVKIGAILMRGAMPVVMPLVVPLPLTLLTVSPNTVFL
jgi:hypothetical protein